MPRRVTVSCSWAPLYPYSPVRSEHNPLLQMSKLRLAGAPAPVSGRAKAPGRRTLPRECVQRPEQRADCCRSPSTSPVGPQHCAKGHSASPRLWQGTARVHRPLLLPKCSGPPAGSDPGPAARQLLALDKPHKRPEPVPSRATWKQ